MKDPSRSKAKQHTPKGVEIPVPKRDKLMADLRKLVQPVKTPKR